MCICMSSPFYFFFFYRRCFGGLLANDFSFLNVSSNKDIYKGYGIGKVPVETTGEVVKNSAVRIEMHAQP